MVRVGKWVRFIFGCGVIGLIVGVDVGFGLMVREVWRMVVVAVGWSNFMMIAGALAQMNVVVVAYSLRSLYYLWKR